MAVFGAGEAGEKPEKSLIYIHFSGAEESYSSIKIHFSGAGEVFIYTRCNDVIFVASAYEGGSLTAGGYIHSSSSRAHLATDSVRSMHLIYRS